MLETSIAEIVSSTLTFICLVLLTASAISVILSFNAHAKRYRLSGRIGPTHWGRYQDSGTDDKRLAQIDLPDSTSTDPPSISFLKGLWRG